jgi:aminotransferase
VRDGAIEAIRAGKSAYSFAEGIQPLREAIAKKLERHNGLCADPSSEIVVTAGSSGAYASALFALLDPGDGILLMEPYYGYHLNTAIVAGLEPQFLSLQPPRFRLEEAALRAALKPNTRAIVVCTPSNPCGRMLDESELRVLEKVAKERDLIVITDEIYEYIRYDGRAHVPPAAIGSLGERTVTIMGLSKTFSITGWRLGYAVAREDWARAIALVHDLFFICAPTPLQHGVAEGFRAPKSYFDDLQQQFAKKREWACDALARAGLDPIVPEGAYYVLADVSKLGLPTSRDAAMAILEQTKVATVPGTSFFQGTAGEALVRVCYAKEDDVLRDACARLATFRA